MLDFLLELVRARAVEVYDGHFTIMSFGTGFKAMFKTPSLDCGQDRAVVRALTSHDKLEDCLKDLLLKSFGVEE